MKQMKKTAIALATLAAAVLTSSCLKENNKETDDFVPATVNAVAGDLEASKADMAYKYDIVWNEGDKIYIAAGKKSDTFTLSKGAGTKAGTFTQDNKILLMGSGEAYYPENLKETGDPVWPGEQTGNTKVPMFTKLAVSGKTINLGFKSLGSVLQIVFNTKQSGVALQSIKIKDGQKTMSGAFTIDADGKAVISASDGAGICLNLGEGTPLGEGANVFNIAVPAGDYQDLSVIFTATDGKTCTFTGGKVNIPHNTVSRLTLTGTAFKDGIPAGALPGMFTVANDGAGNVRIVYFSQGNLWADAGNPNAPVFHFETNQYDSQTSWSTSHVSHFFWSKEGLYAVKQEYSFAESCKDKDILFSNSQVDGYPDVPNPKFTVEGVANKYRTLTKDEWHYLIYNHTYKRVTVCNKVGLVIVPDVCIGGYVFDAAKTTYDAAEWNKAQQGGLVFLPASGSRNGSTISDFGKVGSYWAAQAKSKDSAYRLYFDTTDPYPNPDSQNARLNGFPIRLVTELKQEEPVCDPWNPDPGMVNVIYLNNGKIQLGVDLDRGGSVFHISDAKFRTNMVNYYDAGRYLQQSYYGDPDGTYYETIPWRYNPIQGGACYTDVTGKVVSCNRVKNTLTIESIPVHWVGGYLLDECRMKEVISLEGNVIKIRYSILYNGAKQHAVHEQEIPSFYPNFEYGKLVYYEGNIPWVEGGSTFKEKDVVPSLVLEGINKYLYYGEWCEKWAAFVNTSYWGIGLYSPSSDHCTYYRYGDNKTGHGGSKGDYVSYFAPSAEFALTPGKEIAYDCYVTVGDITEIRQRFAKIHSEE